MSSDDMEDKLSDDRWIPQLVRLVLQLLLQLSTRRRRRFNENGDVAGQLWDSVQPPRDVGGASSRNGSSYESYPHNAVESIVDGNMMMMMMMTTTNVIKMMLHVVCVD